MTAMLSGVVMIAAFGFVAAAGLIFVGALYRTSGRAAGRSDGDPGQADSDRG